MFSSVFRKTPIEKARERVIHFLAKISHRPRLLLFSGGFFLLLLLPLLLLGNARTDQ